jgi:hypothetical protein
MAAPHTRPKIRPAPDVRETHHWRSSNLTAGELLSKAPAPCPDIFLKAVTSWDPTSLALLTSQEVPYMIIAEMAMNRRQSHAWTTLAALADRYRDLKDVQINAPVDYAFSPDKCSAYSLEHSTFAATRLGQVFRTVQQARSDLILALTDTDNGYFATLAAKQVRTHLEAIYEARTGHPPNESSQGTDHYLCQQFRECYQGDIGFFDHSKIVGTSATPGCLTAPGPWHPWMDMLETFRTTLLMTILANPHSDNLDIDKDFLEDWYRSI